jgi:hypothetical protein
MNKQPINIIAPWVCNTQSGVVEVTDDGFAATKAVFGTVEFSDGSVMSSASGSISETLVDGGTY